MVIRCRVGGTRNKYAYLWLAVTSDGIVLDDRGYGCYDVHMEDMDKSGNEYGRFESALRKILAVPKEQVKKAEKRKRKRKPKKKS